jgi:hypothetical protein
MTPPFPLCFKRSCEETVTNKPLQDYLDRLYVSTEQRIQERVAAAAAASGAMRFR